MRIYRAKLYNFIGSFYQAYALTFNKFPVFFEAALQNFTKASNLVKNWFQPYENLADTYVMYSKELAEQKSLSGGTRMVGSIAPSTIHITLGRTVPPSLSNNQDQDMEYLFKALINYEKALRLLPRRLSLPPEKKVTIEHRIRIGKYTAQLLTGDKHLIDEAIDGIIDVQKSLDITKEKDSHLLYNLASWYGIADSKSIQEAVKAIMPPGQTLRQAAIRYLMYSLARDNDLWYWAPRDPSFFKIFGSDRHTKFEMLTLALTQEISEVPDLSQSVGPKFEQAIKEAINRVDWLKNDVFQDQVDKGKMT